MVQAAVMHNSVWSVVLQTGKVCCKAVLLAVDHLDADKGRPCS